MRKVRLDTLKTYRGPADRTHTRRCDHAGCKNPGDFRAPKSRRQLKEYYWFCFDHVQAYNKAWNYHEGMTADEIEAHLRAAVIGERPLWPLGLRGNQFWGSRRRYRDPFEERLGLFDEMGGASGDGSAERGAARARPATLADQALATLGLTGPADIATIKQHYKRLVKRYHPDANGGGDQAAEEQLKRINEAYAILKKRMAS